MSDTVDLSECAAYERLGRITLWCANNNYCVSIVVEKSTLRIGTPKHNPELKDTVIMLHDMNDIRAEDSGIDGPITTRICDASPSDIVAALQEMMDMSGVEYTTH